MNKVECQQYFHTQEKSLKQTEREPQKSLSSVENSFRNLIGLNNKSRLLAGTKKTTLKHFNKLFSAFSFESLPCGLENLTRRERYMILYNFYYPVSEIIILRTVLPSALIYHSHFQRRTLVHWSSIVGAQSTT